MKPKCFIGSSSESLDVAYALQENLEAVAEVSVWDQGRFQLSQSYVQSLLEELNQADFGIFVFTPDDSGSIRGESVETVRDNVIFELGLFVGRLGFERCYMVVPRESTNLRIPSDLAGIASAPYTPSSDISRLPGALGPASNKIRRAMQRVAMRNEPEVNRNISGLWGDTFEIEGEPRAALIYIHKREDGYFLEGQEYNKDIQKVNYWRSDYAHYDPKNRKLEYFYNARVTLPGEEPIERQGFTSIDFSGPASERPSVYSGFFKDYAKIRSSHIAGRRIEDANLTMYNSHDGRLELVRNLLTRSSR